MAIVLNSENHARTPRRDPWARRLLWFLSALLLWRIFYLAVVPFDLVHDEAYYWDWSRNLDWGYFSKPPGIAWLIAASCRLGGDTPLFVRLPAAILATAGLWFGFQLARELYSSRNAFWITLGLALTPGNAALGTMMTIDAPLLFCWSLALWSGWRAVHGGARHAVGDSPEANEQARPNELVGWARLARSASSAEWTWWALAALATGIGLLFKQTMLAFPPLLAVFLFLDRKRRIQLLRPAFWCYLVAALAFLLPVLIWNLEHDWITLRHTSGHFDATEVSLFQRLLRSLEFVGTQFGLATPILCGLLVLAVTRVLRSGRGQPREQFLLVFSALPLAGVLVLSLRQEIEPNWPAVCWVAGMILAGGHALESTAKGVDRRPDGTRLGLGWYGRGLALAAGMTAMTYASPWLLSALDLDGSRVDPLVRMRGWERLADAVHLRLERAPAAPAPILVALGRAEVSELAFYLPGQPRVYHWNGGQEIGSQYDLWPTVQPTAGASLWVLTPARQPPPQPLLDSFAELADHGTIMVPVGNGRRHSLHVWRLEGYGEPPSLRTALLPPTEASQ